MRNYQIGFYKQESVPFILSRGNFKRNKLNDQLSYPLQVFKKTKKIITEKRFYENLKQKLLKKLGNWKKFKPIRGKIEDFFKLLKQGLNMREIHKYTPKLVEKTVYLNVFLGALIISQGFYSKQPYNNYLKTKKFRLLNILFLYLILSNIQVN